MTITKSIALVDGRTLEFHQIGDVTLDIGTSRAVVVVNSWESASSASEKPALRTLLGMAYDTWVPEHLDAMDASVSEHPDWSGQGELRPSAAHTWNPVTLVWVAPASVPLADLKDAAWTRIKASRESAIDAYLVTPYGTFDCKAKDRTNMTDAVLMLQTLNAIGQPTTIDFTLADNSTVVLTTTEMVTVALLLGQKVQAAHSQARALRTSIDAASSAAELELISWV